MSVMNCIAHAHIILSLGAAISVGCTQRQGPSRLDTISGASPEELRLPAEQDNSRWSVWTAVLRYYRARVDRTEGDRARESHSMLDRSLLTVEAPVSVILFHRAADGDSAWLSAIQNDHLVERVCSTASLGSCPETTLSTYLVLEAPVFVTATKAYLHLREIALNPARCAEVGGILDQQLLVVWLTKQSGTWLVQRLETDFRATGICGPFYKRKGGA